MPRVSKKSSVSAAPALSSAPKASGTEQESQSGNPRTARRGGVAASNAKVKKVEAAAAKSEANEAGSKTKSKRGRKPTEKGKQMKMKSRAERDSQPEAARRAAADAAGKMRMEATAERETPRKRGRKPTNIWRVHVAVPGLLWPAIEQRWAEHGYEEFSDFAVELVCFDLRTLFGHRITQSFSQESQDVQEAIDRAIVAHYAPSRRREDCFMLGVLFDRLDDRSPSPSPSPQPAPTGSVSQEADFVKFPKLHKPCIAERWKALGYSGLSSYVTGLIRYDLALGGMHHYFNGADKDPQILASLDQETEAAFREGKTERIRLLDFIEDAAGRKLTKAEYLDAIERLREKMKAAALNRGKHPASRDRAVRNGGT